MYLHLVLPPLSASTYHSYSLVLCPQRLIPVDASNDLFVYKTPEVPLNHAYVIRPYLPEDRDKLYRLILRTSDDGRDGTTLYAAHTDLPGDL